MPRPSAPLIKGRMTLYFFQERYDYTEFGKMVEQRQIPPDSNAHWRYSIVDAYAAVVPARSDEAATKALLLQQIASTFIACLAVDVPQWFAEGCGRLAVTRTGSVAAQNWDRRVPEMLSQMSKTDDFLNNRLAVEANDIASYGFVKFLMTDRQRMARLLDGLRGGQPFDRAFSAAYGATAAQVADRWVRSAVRAR